ncbi:MAG: hypothetical protein GOV01_01435 [Candidatus Altiarchaeota archaeon]|nr:hypothetical protein [Candidatus Altiarchaeota archaeon]
MDMRALAKQLKTKQLSPTRVTFEFEDEVWEFENPQVVEANMMGNVVFQVLGTYNLLKDSSGEDLKLIMEKTNCTKEEAENALKEHKDVAEAIIHIMG